MVSFVIFFYSADVGQPGSIQSTRLFPFKEIVDHICLDCLARRGSSKFAV
jgi:hypothetical protein